MRFVASFILLLLCTSCFLMPLGAPHYHTYTTVTENKFVNKVEVFDTPKIKTYHFFAKEGLEIKGCSKTFLDSCYSFQHGLFFNQKKYQKEIKIKDRKFLKLLKKDTLELFINDQKIVFVPVLK